MTAPNALTPIVGPLSSLAADAHALDEVEVALAVDGLLEPARVDAASPPRLALEQLQTQLSQLSPTVTTAWGRLAALGFQGNSGNYQDIRNSSLSWVLASRRGIPISLAVVLIAVARHDGCRAHGLNHPGHFLVRVDATLVDPFKMAELPMDSAGYAQAQQAPIASPRDLSLRMLNNLKHGAVQRQDFVAALDFLDHQISVCPEAWDLWFEKARFWQQLGSHTSAMAIAQALQGCQLPEPLSQAVAVQLAHLQALPPEVLH